MENNMNIMKAIRGSFHLSFFRSRFLSSPHQRLLIDLKITSVVIVFFQEVTCAWPALIGQSSIKETGAKKVSWYDTLIGCRVVLELGRRGSPVVSVYLWTIRNRLYIQSYFYLFVLFIIAGCFHFQCKVIFIYLN